jgi:8-oxo-dGTP pyrophosphatase MutT (NUDIX family)
MIRSAGIVVVRKTKLGWKFLLLRAYSYWDFPKGKAEEGEALIETALRETEEESGVVDLDFCWGKSYKETEPYGKKKKIARYYIAKTKQKKITLNFNEELGRPEHNEYRWVKFKELEKLASPRILKIAQWANEILETENEIR